MIVDGTNSTFQVSYLQPGIGTTNREVLTWFGDVSNGCGVPPRTWRESSRLPVSGSDPTTIGTIGLSNSTSGTLSVIGGTCATGVTPAYGQTSTVRLSAKAVPTVSAHTATLTSATRSVAPGRSRSAPRVR